jgi:transcriptional regulator with XRE-family HTH domain
MSLGERIKLVRMQKKMSQSELAKLAQVHQKNISKYENDGVVPSALTIKGIAQALEVTTDYLLGAEREDVIKDTTLLGFFKEVDNMPDEAKEALSRVIQAYVRDYKASQAYAR